MALAFFWGVLNIKPTQLGDEGTALFKILVQWVQPPILHGPSVNLALGNRL